MDITVLVFAWHCEAEVMCEFKHDEFVKGMMSLGVDSIDKLRSKVSYMQSELRDDNKFRVRFLMGTGGPSPGSFGECGAFITLCTFCTIEECNECNILCFPFFRRMY